MQTIEFLFRDFWGLEDVKGFAQCLSTCLTHRNPGVNPCKLKITHVTCSATFMGEVQAVYRMLYFHLAEYILNPTKWRILNWTRPVTQPTTWNLSDLDPQRHTFHTFHLVDRWRGSFHFMEVSQWALFRKNASNWALLVWESPRKRI